jgi:hypothetical protein
MHASNDRAQQKPQIIQVSTSIERIFYLRRSPISRLSQLRDHAANGFD